MPVAKTEQKLTPLANHSANPPDLFTHPNTAEPAAEEPQLEAGPAVKDANATVNATAAPAATAAAAPAQPDSPAWSSMVARIKELEGVCKRITQKWECNSGTVKCAWDTTQVRCVWRWREGGRLVGWLGLHWFV